MDIRNLITGAKAAPGSSGRKRPLWMAVVTVLAVAVAIGVLPALVVVIGGIAISTAALAGGWLLLRQTGTVSRLSGYFKP